MHIHLHTYQTSIISVYLFPICSISMDGIVWEENISRKLQKKVKWWYFRTKTPTIKTITLEWLKTTCVKTNPFKRQPAVLSRTQLGEAPTMLGCQTCPLLWGLGFAPRITLTLGRNMMGVPCFCDVDMNPGVLKDFPTPQKMSCYVTTFFQWNW